MQEASVTTAEQLLELHEPGFCHELVRGELRRMSNAGSWHSAVALEIGRLLANHVCRHRLGYVTGADGGFLLERTPDTVRTPEAAFVALTRLATLPARGYVHGAPDLAVEVTSPNDTYAFVHEKALFWIVCGARLVWVVEPIARLVTIYRPDHSQHTLRGGDVLTGDDVLPGFAVRVAELFPG